MSKAVRFQNSFLMFVSLVLAVVLWLVVQSQNVRSDTHRDTQLRVTPINIDWGKFITVKEPPLVTVSVSGVDDFKGFSEDMATIDLSDAHVGKNTCLVYLQLPPGVKRDQISVTPKRVDIYLDYRVTRTRDVELKLSGLQPGQYVFNGVTKQTSQVDLSGPEKSVDSVKHVQVIFDLSKARPGVDQALPVEPLDTYDKIVPNVKCNPVAIVARANLAPAPPKTIRMITPSWTGHLAFGYEPAGLDVQPNVVEVTGKSEVLSQLTTIYTEPIPVEGLSEDKTFEVKLVVPRGVSIGGPTKVKVHLKVVKSSAGSQPSRPASGG